MREQIKTLRWQLGLVLGLLIVMTLSACGPVSAPTSTPQEPVQQVVATSTVAVEPVVAGEPVNDTSPQAPAAAPTEEVPMVIPTSRGDQLEATDPATVALASDGLQLVEFFRFT